jgi:hypothetical protein
MSEALHSSTVLEVRRSEFRHKYVASNIRPCLLTSVLSEVVEKAQRRLKFKLKLKLHKMGKLDPG